jgi:osmoprotectant transport system ATP-binding protein
MSISINNLNFSYGDKQVLKNINLKIDEGELIAIMGLSGCGKTTLLRLLLGLHPIEDGDVNLNEIEYCDINIVNIRKKISYIPQHGALFPHMNIRKNILLPISINRTVVESDHEKIDELATICNIDTELLDRFPSELSGGQRQRISILRALLMDTPYIFMDEPLSALDPITKISIQKEFKDIFKQSKKTLIMVTHSLTEAKFLCDKLAIINDGEIVQFDHTEKVISNPNEGFVSNFINAQL